MVIVRFHTNAAGLPSGTVRYLKVKNEADCFGILFDRLIIAAHLVSPHFALGHFTFLIRSFVDEVDWSARPEGGTTLRLVKRF